MGFIPRIFNAINHAWGPLTLDCFASFYNAQLPHFFSRFWNPGAQAIDAFAQDWTGENVLLVPPAVLIPQVLNHFCSCQGRQVLVFPWWPASPFWPLLWTTYRPYIRDLITKPGNTALVHGRNKNSILGSPEFTGIMAMVKLSISPD